MFNLDSDEIWLQVRFFMTLKSYLLEAEVELKIGKHMPWREFMKLLQKLALDTWNKCFNTVFQGQRDDEIRKAAESFRFSSAEDLPKVADHMT